MFVLLGGGTSQANQPPNADEPTDQPGLVEELRDRVESLERRLDRELERHGDETERLHQIIAGLTQANTEQARAIRAIEAPATEDVTEDAEKVEGPGEGRAPVGYGGRSDVHREPPGGRGATPVVAQTVGRVAVVEGLCAVLALIAICGVVLEVGDGLTTWASHPPQRNGWAGKPAHRLTSYL